MLPLFTELQAQGINPEELLKKHDIDLDTLSANTLLNIENELMIVKDALDMVNDPLFGLRVGNQITITSYGLFALLLLSAPTFKDVVDITVRYQRLNLSFTHVTAHYGEGFVEVRNHLPDLSGKLRQFVADRDFAGNAVFIREIQGDRPDLLLGCGLARPRPSDQDLPRFTSLLKMTPVFEQDYNWIRLPSNILTMSSKHSNSLAHKLFKVQAQELLRDYFSDSGDIVAQINLIFDGVSTQYPKLPDIAEQFKTSESTLRRQLQRSGHNYRQLLDQHRKKRALQIIEAEQTSVADLAERLGYADAMGFLKAFKKWTGKTPKQYILSRAE